MKPSKTADKHMEQPLAVDGRLSGYLETPHADRAWRLQGCSHSPPGALCTILHPTVRMLIQHAALVLSWRWLPNSNGMFECTWRCPNPWDRNPCYNCFSQHATCVLHFILSTPTAATVPMRMKPHQQHTLHMLKGFAKAAECGRDTSNLDFRCTIVHAITTTRPSPLPHEHCNHQVSAHFSCGYLWAGLILLSKGSCLGARSVLSHHARKRVGVSCVPLGRQCNACIASNFCVLTLAAVGTTVQGAETPACTLLVNATSILQSFQEDQSEQTTRLYASSFTPIHGYSWKVPNGLQCNHHDNTTIFWQVLLWTLLLAGFAVDTAT